MAPSAVWYARYLKALMEREKEAEAIEAANSEIMSLSEFSRYELVDSKGEKKIFSLAVEGGRHKLRELPGNEYLRLSEHGNWRKNHLGGLDAILGRTPFYRDFEPELREVYANREIRTLREFNLAILRLIDSFLLKDLKKGELTGFYDNETLRLRGKEIAAYINAELSVIEAVARLGKEALLGILGGLK